MSATGRLATVTELVGAPAVDQACRSGLLVADGDRLRPVHPLYASTAYATAPPSERRALRTALAQSADDPVERAIHLAANTVGHDHRVAEALAEAAAEAQLRGAPAYAADLFTRAATFADIDERRAELLVSAAEAAVAAGDPATGDARLRAALAVMPHGPTRARALLALAEIVYVQQPAGVVALLMEALEHVDGDFILEATVHSYLAGLGDMDPDRANHGADRAATILQRPDVVADPDHLACALLDREFHRLRRGDAVQPEDIARGAALRTGKGTGLVARRAQEVAERCLFHLA